jgi:hypothetical protein
MWRPLPCGETARGFRSLGTLVFVRCGDMPMFEVLFLVLDDGAIELIGQTVDRRVHVRIDAFAENILAAHVDARFHLMAQFLD